MKKGLGFKLTLSYAAILIIMVFVVVSGIKRINDQAQEYQYINDVQNAISKDSLAIKADFFMQQSRLRGYIITHDAKIKDDFEATKADIGQLLDKIDSLVMKTSNETRPVYTERVNNVKEARKNFIEYAASMFNLVNEGIDSEYSQQTALDTQMEEIRTRMSQVGDKILRNLNDSVNQLLEYCETRQNDRTRQLISSQQDNIRLQYVLLITAVIIATIIAIYLTRSIVIPINNVTGVANALAAGDLTKEAVNYKASDEIGILTRAFNQMALNLRNLIKQVADAAETLASSSEELSASAEQASNATNQVAQTINQIASGSQQEVKAVNDTTESVDSVANAVASIRVLANELTRMSQANAESGQRGTSSVDNVIKGMEEVTETVEVAMDRVQGLVQKSDEIESVVELISSIAEQTNLLALNAAIESARAGEHGRGFAVVAEEVRKLAEKSQQSTKEIAALINGVRKDIEATVKAMDNGGNAVDNTSKLVAEAGNSLQEIVVSAEGAAQEMIKLVDATESINAAVDKVQNAMQSIAAITEETSASAEEVSAAAEEQNATVEEITSSARSLSDMAQSLTILVSKFKV